MDAHEVLKRLRPYNDSAATVITRFETLLKRKLLTCHNSVDGFAHNALKALCEASDEYLAEERGSSEAVYMSLQLERLRRILDIINMEIAEADMELGFLELSKYEGLNFMKALRDYVCDCVNDHKGAFLEEAEALKRELAQNRLSIVGTVESVDDILDWRIEQMVQLDNSYMEFVDRICGMASGFMDAAGTDDICDVAKAIRSYAGKITGYPHLKGTIYRVVYDDVQRAKDKSAEEAIEILSKADANMIEMFVVNPGRLVKGIRASAANAEHCFGNAVECMDAIHKCLADVRTWLQRLFNHDLIKALLKELKYDEDFGGQSMYCMLKFYEVISSFDDVSREEDDGLIKLDLTEFGYPAAYDAYDNMPEG